MWLSSKKMHLRQGHAGRCGYRRAGSGHGCARWPPGGFGPDKGQTGPRARRPLARYRHAGRGPEGQPERPADPYPRPPDQWPHWPPRRPTPSALGQDMDQIAFGGKPVDRVHDVQNPVARAHNPAAPHLSLHSEPAKPAQSFRPAAPPSEWHGDRPPLAALRKEIPARRRPPVRPQRPPTSVEWHQ